MVARISERLEQTLDGFAGVEPAEVVGAEVRIADTVGKQLPHRAEHGSGDREDGFLGAASCLEGAGTGCTGRCFSLGRRSMQP